MKPLRIMGYRGTISLAPVVTDSYSANVSSLLHFDGADASTTFTDQTGKTWTRNGTTTSLSTATKKYGTAGLYIGSAVGGATNNGITTPSHADFNFGTADFTIEWWEYATSLSTYQNLFDRGGLTAGGLLIQSGNGDGKYGVYVSNATVLIESSAKTLNVMQHHALVKDSGMMRKYRDGVQTGSRASAVNITSTDALCFGAYLNGTFAVASIMDDLRITKGVCRYPNGTTFTPPTAAFPDPPLPIVTWNNADKGGAVALTNSNLVASRTPDSSNYFSDVRATLSKTVGKHYFEVYVTDGALGPYMTIGVATAAHNLTTYVGKEITGWSYYQDTGSRIHNDVGSALGVSWTTGDTVGVALDMDAGKIWFAVNGVWQASGNPAAGTAETFSGVSGAVFPMVSLFKGTVPVHSLRGRFAAPDFAYAPPTGFSPWGGSYNAETTTWAAGISTLGGSVTLQDEQWADALITALQGKTYNSKVKYLLPFLGNNIKAHRMPLRDSFSVGSANSIGSAPFIDTDCSSALGISNPTEKDAYLDTKITAGMLGAGNGGLGWYERNIGFGGGTEPIGSYRNSGPDSYRYVIDLRTSFQRFRWGNAGPTQAGPTTTAANGHYYGQRSSSTLRRIYKDGLSLGSDSTGSEAVDGENDLTIYVMGSHESLGAFASWKGRGACAYMTDGSLTDSEVLDFHNLLNAYLITPTGR
jgi:hypothetical protein